MQQSGRIQLKPCVPSVSLVHLRPAHVCSYCCLITNSGPMLQLAASNELIEIGCSYPFHVTAQRIHSERKYSEICWKLWRFNHHFPPKLMFALGVDWQNEEPLYKNVRSISFQMYSYLLSSFTIFHITIISVLYAASFFLCFEPCGLYNDVDYLYIFTATGH